MANIYSLNPGTNLDTVIPSGVFQSSELFVEFLKAYYEWLHTTELTYEIISGTFQKSELIVGNTSKATAQISFVKSETQLIVFVNSSKIPFEFYETFTGQTSGAVARLLKYDDNILRKANQILPNRDVDTSVDIFSEYLKDELYSAIPSSFSGDKRTLAKRIRDYYQSKGHEQSYRFLMKLIYNQDIEIAYPGDEILKVSAGNFLRETVIRARIIGNDSDNVIFNFLFKTIRGRTSGAIAKVVDIKKVFVGSQYLAEMRLSLVSGVFTAEEAIYDIEDLNEFPLQTTIFGLVSGYTINYGGSGYVPGDILTVTGDGQQATVRIAETYRSGIDSIQLVETGYGYQLGSVTEAINTNTGGSGLIVMVSEIANTYTVVDGANTYTVGDVTEVKIINKGSDYFNIPTIILRDNTIYSLGMISEKNVTIVDAGKNYRPGEVIEFNFGNYTTQAIAEVGSVAEPPDPPSTNYLLFSDQFDLWSLANVQSFSANSEVDTTLTTDPFGDNSAEKIVEFITYYDPADFALLEPDVRHYVEKQVDVETPGYHTFSLYIKTEEGSPFPVDRNAVIHISNNSNPTIGDIVGATVSLTSNTVSTASLGANSDISNSSIEILDNSWRRVSISGKCDDTSNSLYVRVFFHNSETVSYIGNEYKPASNASAGILYVSNAQLEPGNVATTYIESTDAVGIRLGGDFNIYLEDGDGTYNKLMLEEDDFVKYNTTNVVSQEWFGVGPIERIKMLNRGRGYSLANLELVTIDVTTSSGYDANLVLTGIMGDGANVIVDVANNSSGVGSIKRIEPVNFGVDYSTASIVTTGVGNEDANITPVITGSGVTVGRYIDDAGKVDYKKIQDSFFYQQYSYVIKSGIEIAKYKNVLKQMIHPSGLEVFGEIAIRNNLDLRMKTEMNVDDFLSVVLTLTSIPNSGLLKNWSLTNNTESADTLEVYKVADFIGEGNTPIGAITIEQMQNSSQPPPTINTYKYYTFASPFGVAIYFEIEKQRKIDGTVSLNNVTNTITGSGTTFTAFFSDGDEFVVIDRIGSTGSHRFLITQVISDTQMIISASFSDNFVNAEAYSLSI